jgi:LmbE family N-acetylglucosaminyl deacetylase
VCPDLPRRPLIFVAHPDDETIACAGLLQRVPASLVVFATDGAAPGLGGERKYGSLKVYSDLRFQEVHLDPSTMMPAASSRQTSALRKGAAQEVSGV